MTDNSSIRIYKNKIGNRVTFTIKTGHYFELLTFGTMKLHGGTKIKINNENIENVPHLQITNIVLVHCDIVIIIDNDYQHDSRVLYTLVPNKSFRQVLFVSLKIFGIFKKFNCEFSFIEVWFTYLNSKLLEIENKINIAAVIN